MAKVVTVRQALQFVADNPVMADDDVLQKPTYELISRTLFDIANRPDDKVRGSLKRANVARKLIMDRLTGRRRPGSHPATRNPIQLDFVDLTGGELGESSQ